ncbi:MAG: hypothetical protein HUK16_09590 [Bacteroidales bacterium]|nr:hypothetical protein [Bacteroidales bacterium]MCF0201584.1 hypothetical protein [Bacteroidales bacterium]
MPNDAKCHHAETDLGEGCGQQQPSTNENTRHLEKNDANFDKKCVKFDFLISYKTTICDLFEKFHQKIVAGNEKCRIFAAANRKKGSL